MTAGNKTTIYLDAPSLEIKEEMPKGVLSKLCQDAIKGWINKSNDYDILDENLKLLEKDHKDKILSLEKDKEEELSSLNSKKSKIERNIKKENKNFNSTIKKESNKFFSIKNKILELQGEQSREKWENDEFDFNKDNGKKEIRELLRDTFRSYLYYFFDYQKPDGDENTNENYNEEYDAFADPFNDIVNNLFDKFMEDYNGSFNKKYFELKKEYYWIKSFVRTNSNAFKPDIFLKNEDPDRYCNSELYIYMPLKEIGKNIHIIEELTSEIKQEYERNW